MQKTVATRTESDSLLRMIEERIDPQRCMRIDDLYRRTLCYEEIDRPPLVVRAPFAASMSLPEPWGEFRYTYRESFDDLDAMLRICSWNG